MTDKKIKLSPTQIETLHSLEVCGRGMRVNQRTAMALVDRGLALEVPQGLLPTGDQKWVIRITLAGRAWLAASPAPSKYPTPRPHEVRDVDPD